jgi:LysM repeat protein
MQAQRQTSTFTMPPPPIKRAPSYPDWEHPPTAYRFPRLRGNEDHRSMWPLVAVALGVVMVLIVVVVFPMVAGRGGTAAGPTGSAPAATGSVLPSASASPIVSFSLPPGDYYDQYTVQPGDTIARILKKYPGLLKWELLTANPQIANPNILKAGSTINIPQHGQFDPPSATPITTDAPTPSPTDSPAT